MIVPDVRITEAARALDLRASDDDPRVPVRWWESINLEKLYQGEHKSCVLGQLYGKYESSPISLKEGHSWAFDGFDADTKTAHWKALIQARLGVVGEPAAEQAPATTLLEELRLLEQDWGSNFYGKKLEDLLNKHDPQRQEVTVTLTRAEVARLRRLSEQWGRSSTADIRVKLDAAAAAE